MRMIYEEIKVYELKIKLININKDGFIKRKCRH